MNRKEFIEAYSKHVNVSQATGKEICLSMFDLLNKMFDAMEYGEKLTLIGFGTFEKKKVAAKRVGNFSNGSFYIPETSKIVFKRSHTVSKEKDVSETSEDNCNEEE